MTELVVIVGATIVSSSTWDEMCPGPLVSAQAQPDGPRLMKGEKML